LTGFLSFFSFLGFAGFSVFFFRAGFSGLTGPFMTGFSFDSSPVSYLKVLALSGLIFFPMGVF
jgi:hypothetical protein